MLQYIPALNTGMGQFSSGAEKQRINGVNSISIDLPDYTPGNLEINDNPRNGPPYFNTSLFKPNALGTPGTSPRRVLLRARCQQL